MDTDSLYERNELQVMERMAHGFTREQISDHLRLSPSTVARAARSATDKVTGGTGASIIYGIALLVAQGRISVRHNGQKHTAHATALAWLETRVMSALDFEEVVEIRDVYRKMQAEEKD